MNEQVHQDILTKLAKYEDIVNRRKANQKRYFDKVKHTDEYKATQKTYREANIIKLRENCRRSFNKYYHEGQGRSKKQIYYVENKEKSLAKSAYNYYKKRDKIDIFKDKFPDRYALLIEVGYITN